MIKLLKSIFTAKYSYTSWNLLILRKSYGHGPVCFNIKKVTTFVRDLEC